MEHQESDGTLKPPTGFEKTDLPVEGLNKPKEIRRLTLDEADTLRSTRAFVDNPKLLPEWFVLGLNNCALEFSCFIIKNCPEGKERSQALGQVHAAVLWAKEAGIKNNS